MLQILIGDVRARLRELADESVQCVVTSPPYWSLRDYGTEPQIWGGKPDCAHVWISNGKSREHFDRSTCGKDANGSGVFVEERGVQGSRVARGAPMHYGATCATCAAWCGTVGQVAHGLGRDSILIDLNPANELLMRVRCSHGLRDPKRKKPRKCETMEMRFGRCETTVGLGL